MKKKYFDVETEIIFFETQDVITGSTGIFDSENEDGDVTGDDPYGDF